MEQTAPGTRRHVRRWLTATGYTEDLVVDGGILRAAPSGRTFTSDELSVAAAYRVEGAIDADDGPVLFVLASRTGDPVGTFVAPRGPAAAPEDAVVAALREKTPLSTDIRDHHEHDHIVATFATRDEAEAAATDLRRSGLGSEHLSVAVHGTEHVAFEHDADRDIGRDIAVGGAGGAGFGLLAGLALVAVAVPGLGVLGVAGLFAAGAASAFGSAMLGGYLGVAAASREMAEHDEIGHVPLLPGEVLLAVCSHGAPETVEATFLRHGGRLIKMPSVRY